MAYDKQTNPFYSHEEDNSFGAPKYSQNKYGAASDPFSFGDGGGAATSKYERLQQMKENSMNNQLESTQRCIASIYDSEAMGIATAEELVQQGEQLDNVDQKLDKINQDMKTSQKHLNSIKSIFGGFKNWWKGENKPEESGQQTQPKSNTSSKLTTAMEQSQQSEAYDAHPAYRSKTGGTQGFYDDDDLDDKFLGAGSRRYDRPEARQQHQQGAARDTGPKQPQQSQAVQSGGSARDEQFDANLDVMSSGMMRLKGLAQGLGSEIERQNEQLDKIMPKADRADIKLTDQNRQMRKILR